MKIVNLKLRRALVLIFLLLTSALGTYIILSNLNDNILFFYPPSDMEKILNAKGKVRVGGLVSDNIEYNNSDIIFSINDNFSSLKISYRGAPPAMFRAKQGIVAEGKYDAKKEIFIATRLLTKHDENYKPPA